MPSTFLLIRPQVTHSFPANSDDFFFFFFSNQVQFVFPDTLRNQPFSGMVTLPGAKIPNNNSKTQEQQQKSISFLPATIKQH